MAQLFRPSSNTIARVVLFLFVVLPWVIIYIGSWYSRSPYNTKVAVPIHQPVPFSHVHHAFELGINCQFCHTSVEKSSFAGFPDTYTCMTCHSQIWTNSPLLEPVRKSHEENIPIKWDRVNRVPDFVYFNHSIHINRGINCNVCHGPVQSMPITYKGQPFEMIWCLNCHRDPEKFLYRDKEAEAEGLSPKQQVFNLYLKYQEGVPLTARERSLLEGVDYDPTEEEIKEGKKLIKKYGVKVQQLADCWICHR